MLVSYYSYFVLHLLKFSFLNLFFFTFLSCYFSCCRCLCHFFHVVPLMLFLMLFFSRCYLHYSFCATSPWVLTFFFALPLLPRYNFHVLHLLCLSFHVAPLTLPLPRCFYHIVILALLLSCYSSHVAPFKLQHTMLFVSHYISSPTTTLLAFF